MKATVEGDEATGYIPTTPPDPALLAALLHDMAPLRPSVMPQVLANGTVLPTSIGTKVDILLELAVIKAAVRTWHTKQPDEVLRESSAYSARLTEMWTELRLLEQHYRDFAQIRTMQVQPVLDELDRQYKINQSRIAMARQDLDMIRAGA